MPDRLFANNIEREFEKSNSNIRELDRLTYSYVFSKEVERKTKIIFLWNLLKKYENDHDRFEYIESTLSVLGPHEIIPDIIVSYHQASDPYIKLKFLDLLFDCVIAKDFTKTNPNFDVANLFFKQTLLNENNPQIVSQLIAYYPLLFMNSEIYQARIDKLEVIKKKDINQCTDVVVFNSSFWGGLFQFMINEKGKQLEWFEKNLVLADKYSDDPDFRTHLPHRLKQEYKHNDFLVEDMFYISLRDFMETKNPGELEPEAARKIHDYLINRIIARPLPRSDYEEDEEAIRAIIKREEEKRDQFNETQKRKIIKT